MFLFLLHPPSPKRTSEEVYLYEHSFDEEKHEERIKLQETVTVFPPTI